MLTTSDEILARLHSMANAENVIGMARYGINTHQTLGISIYDLRKLAREIGVNHALAKTIWETGIHEARILAGIIADPSQVDEVLLETWVADFDSWDVCDQVCDLFSRSQYAYAKVFEWAERSEEFVKRASFVIIAHLAVYDKSAANEKLAQFFPLLIRHADDPRNFVKKAVNWALRNLGKRNRTLNQQAIETAQAIRLQNTTPARWISSDALRELSSDKVQNRIKD